MSLKSAVTIGNFDGVHLGHQAILDELTSDPTLISIIITFKNHPSTLFNPGKPIKIITSQEHKLELLQQKKVHHIYTLPFTHEFAQQSPIEFLTFLKEKFNMVKLILGENARLGKDQSGDKESIIELSHAHEFEAKYLPLLTVNGEHPTSSLIRQSIASGKLNKASELLGRPYSIKVPLQRGRTSLKEYSIPPNGTYSCQINDLQLPLEIANDYLVNTQTYSCLDPVEILFL